MKEKTLILAAQVAVVGVIGLTQGCATAPKGNSARRANAPYKRSWGAHARLKAAREAQETGSDEVYVQETTNPEMIDTIDMTPVEDTSVQATMLPPAQEGTFPMTSSTSYTVQKGDTLSGIAVKFGSTTKELAAMNGISDPNKLYVGQELQVPGAGGASSSSYKSSSSSSKKSGLSKGASYTIQKGDSLSKIAIAFGVSVSDLRKLNNMSGDFIVAGETLEIPSYGRSTPKTVTNSKKKSSTKKKAKKEPKKAAPPVEPSMAPEPELEPAFEPELIPADPVAAAPETERVETVIDHIVYPTETLDDIARQYGVSKGDIVRLNNLDPNAPVQDGMRLRIAIPE